ncbi:unnamed protein product, partial [Menidia menidia]
MYSVEDLLISHGYKLPKHNASSTPRLHNASSSHQPLLSTPPSYNEHHGILEKRHQHGTVNGCERRLLVPFGNNNGLREHQIYSCSNSIQPQNRNQLKRESKNQGHTDTHSLGKSLTSDSGFCDVNKGHMLHSNDVAYWRRRGQDFTVLLDYADFKELQKARGQELPRVNQEWTAQQRQLRATQSKAQHQVQALCKKNEAVLHQSSLMNDRKYQSLETDEWHSAVGFGRQLHKTNSERWVQGQQRFYAGTPEGTVVHPTAKSKCQSLPRMLQPDSLQYVDIALSSQELYSQMNGHPLSHHHHYRLPRRSENGRPASANQLSMTPNPRFTRPPRPPSYEMHQQIRGSCELLSGRELLTPQTRDRTPLPIARTPDPHLDSFAHDSGPPVYIPPPSYKRAPIMAGGLQNYGQIAVDYRCRGDMYQQIKMAPDESHWFIRYPAGSWPHPHMERSVSCQKQCYPLYSSKENRGGVKCIPFDDPCINKFSSALGGNSLTDADKIRHIRNELPSIPVSELSQDDSAFLAPPPGPFVAVNLTSSSCDNKRWQSNLHKETVDNLPATDQNCNRHHKTHHPSPSPFSAFQASLPRTSSYQGSRHDKICRETITQVKKIVPDSRTEMNSSTKRRVSETIFCLVSVPVHMPSNFSNNLSGNQDNEAIANLTITNTGTFAVGLKESANIRSKSVNEIPVRPHIHTSSKSSTDKRAPLRKETIDAWAYTANEDKKLGCTGSWPGNQYRNQETQTCSLLTVVNSPEPHTPNAVQEAVLSVSKTDSDVANNSSSSYSYPMAGQKNLHLSSNSAFSRLSPISTQIPLFKESEQEPYSVARNQEEQRSSSPRESIHQESPEKVVFGQFLLKPVNRRPCDASGELETINRDMEEDTIKKTSSVGQLRDDLDRVNKRQDWFKSKAHFIVGPEPGREAISLPPLHTGKNNIIKKKSKSFASTVDIDSIDMPHANHTTLKKNLYIHSNSQPSCFLSSVLPQSELNQLYRQDIPVPQESLLRDVGLTVYTETPGAPGEPMQRSLSVPSPINHKDLHSVQLSWKTRRVLVENSGESNSNEELECKMNKEQKASSDNVPPFRGEVIVSICKTKNESYTSPQKESMQHIARQVSFVVEDDKRYMLAKPMICKNDSTIADKQLESLLIQEKNNTLPAEVLSSLHEIRYGKGISENESIEERAARILGITVPVEALSVADKQSGNNQVKPPCPNALAKQPTGECEQVIEASLTADLESVKETLSVTYIEEQEDLRNMHSSDHSNSGDKMVTETQSMRELPKFLANECVLFPTVIPDEKLSPSMFSEVKKDNTSRVTRSLPNKMNCSVPLSATSLAGSRTNRMASVKEQDFVSQIKNNNLTSPKHLGEAFNEKDTTKKNEVQKESKKEIVMQHPQKVDAKGQEQECQGDYQNDQIKLGHFDQVQGENDRLCNRDQRHEGDVEEMTVEIELKTGLELNKEVHVELKMEEGKMEFKIVEEDKENPLDMMNDEHNTIGVNIAATSQYTEGGKLPKPKQHTRFQIPPLHPKPCNVVQSKMVPALSLSTGTCINTVMEDEEMLSSAACSAPPLSSGLVDPPVPDLQPSLP